MSGRASSPARIVLCLAGVLSCGTIPVEAGGPFRPRRFTQTVARPVEPSPYPMLGTFRPDPFTMVRGNFPVGGGFSPLDTFGDQTLVMYGPISSFRSFSAPVRQYARGYDGRPVIVEGTSFSTPNQPDLTPVVYPTRATDFYAPRSLSSPPWWANGITWIDQN